ncbi:hypothetical protein CR513_11002, partial [Mucuna pruriens]
MNFVGCLSWTTMGVDTIWVIVDKLRKCAPYIKEVVRLHTISSSIVPDQDSRNKTKVEFIIPLTDGWVV